MSGAIAHAVWQAAGRHMGVDQDLAAAFLWGCDGAFMAVDPDYRVIGWNPAMERLLGWSASEVLGGVPPHVDPVDVPAVRGALGRTDDVLPAVSRCRRRDGTQILVVDEPGTPLRDADGRIVGYGRFLREAGVGEVTSAQRHEASRAFLEAVRVDDVRETLAVALSGIFGCSRAIVLRPLEGAAMLVGHLAVGLNQEAAEQIGVPVAAALADVPRSRQGVLVRMPIAGWNEEWFAVPMGPSAAGWVLAMALTRPLENEHSELAAALAGEAWAALRRVELVGELEAKVEVLEATAAVSSSAGLDLDQVLEAVCRQAAAALSCERAAVYLFEGEQLRLAHLQGAQLEAVLDEGARAATEILRQRTHVVVQDASAAHFLDGPWRPEHGTVSVMGVPLRIRERDLGVLVVAHTVEQPRGFTNLCQLVGGAVAQQAALAIENARLFRDEQDTVARLEELNRLKIDYMDGITHDLRTPLTGLLGFVKTLRRLDEVTTSEERAEYLDVIERQATRLAGLVGDMLTSARLEAGQLTPDDTSRVPLSELVDETLSVLDPDRRRRMRVSLADVDVWGDRSQLQRVVQNLVDNALKYSPSPLPVDITIDRDDEQAVVAVADRGPGIADELRRRLFSRFGRGAHGATGDSNGLGLCIVEGIVRAHGGTVACDSRPDGGTVFSVRLRAA